MVRVSPIQTNFTAGELSPRLEGRVDISKYFNGCKVLENMVIHPHGGASRRSGTRYVANVKDQTKKPRLMPFEFSTLQAYMLEAGNLYIRFFRNEGQIIVADTDAAIANGTFDSGITDWDDRSTGTASIAHDATNKRLDLVGAASSVAWAEQDVTTTDTGQVHVLRFQVFGAAGDTVELRIGTTSTGNEIVNDVAFGVGTHAYAFTPNASPFYVQFRNGTAKTLAIDDVSLIDNGPVEITTPYLEADLFELQFAQSADVMYITHPNYAPRKLSRTGHTSWSLTEIAFEDGPYLDENTSETTITASAETGNGITLTASAALFKSGHVDSLWQLKEATQSLPFDDWVQNKTYSISDFVKNDGKVYEAKTGGASGTRPPIHDEGTESDGNVDWEFLHDGAGYVKVTGFTSSTVVTADVKSRLPASATSGTKHWAEGVWSTVQGYPSCVTFYEERLFFAGSTEKPQTVWGSKSADFENMTPGVNDDDALAFTIASDEVNAIRWLSPGKVLAIGTTGGEYTMRATAQDEPVTPTNVQVKRETTRGCAYVLPIRNDAVVLFLQRALRKIREFVFTFETDSFASPDLTILAEHVTRGGLVQLAYAREPDPVIWAVRADGTLLGMTYERTQDVVGWHRHILGGSFGTGNAAVESAAVIPSPNGDHDQLWLVVKRTINGASKRYVEFLEQQFEEGDAQADAFFVDSGLTYEGAPATTISGLDHLEGETVSVLADGAVEPDKTVFAGAIALTNAASKVQVGLAYRSKVQTMRFDAGARDGTSQGKKARIHEVTVRFFNTLGAKVGFDDDVDVIVFRDASDPMDSAPPLFSGDKRIKFKKHYTRAPRVTVIQDQPLPITVLAIMPRMATFDG